MLSNEDSDQPVHPGSLLTVFADQGSKTSTVQTEQTPWMPSLFCDFAVHAHVTIRYISYVVACMYKTVFEQRTKKKKKIACAASKIRSDWAHTQSD